MEPEHVHTGCEFGGVRMVLKRFRKFGGKKAQEVPKKEEPVADGHPYRTAAIVPGRKVREKIFTGNSLDDALEKCDDEGYRALFMPEVIKSRIAHGMDAPIWQFCIDNLSLIATGKTKQDVVVVVFAHVPHYFSDWRNIRQAKREGKIKNGAGILPQEEFYRLLDLEDAQKVFVLDHATLMRSPYGYQSYQSVDTVIQHPFTKPYFGLCEDEISVYLEKHKTNYGNDIGIWYPREVDDLPNGRLLFVDNSYYGLLDGDGLDNSGRFVGVVPEAPDVRP